MMQASLRVLLVVVACVSSGCGYTLAGRGSFLPPEIKIIGIPPFVNRTQVFNLETQLTQKVRTEFIGRGRYQILPEATGVDAVLTGEISGVSLTPLSMTQQQLASRYAITMTANVELRETKGNTVLWENPSLIFRGEYDAPSSTTALPDPAVFLGQDANALERMTNDFARTIVSAILEAF
jgi:lipopolysaccharide assembly LptE-like protein